MIKVTTCKWPDFDGKDGWKRPNNDGISPDWDVKWPDGDGKEGWGV